MVKKLTGAEKKVKKKFKKNLKDSTKWNRKMGGRSCFLTSGAFGHGLPSRRVVGRLLCVNMFISGGCLQ